jgi:hypothetical protein
VTVDVADAVTITVVVEVADADALVFDGFIKVKALDLEAVAEGEEVTVTVALEVTDVADVEAMDDVAEKATEETTEEDVEVWTAAF